MSIRGTSTNCAGGSTPWDSWLSCEETIETVGGVAHGYVFEVPSSADGPVDAVPLEAMGRFVHEAVALDPATGIAYETEDRRISGDDDATGSGFYRFTPTPGTVFGTAGRLEMLAVEGRLNHDTSTGQRPSWCCSSSPATRRSWRPPTTSASAPAAGCWFVRTAPAPVPAGHHP